jgi:hypothetical protein
MPLFCMPKRPPTPYSLGISRDVCSAPACSVPAAPLPPTGSGGACTPRTPHPTVSIGAEGYPTATPPGEPQAAVPKRASERRHKPGGGARRCRAGPSPRGCGHRRGEGPQGCGPTTSVPRRERPERRRRAVRPCPSGGETPRAVLANEGRRDAAVNRPANPRARRAEPRRRRAPSGPVAEREHGRRAALGGRGVGESRSGPVLHGRACY